MFKKLAIINLLIIVTTSVQVLWSAPDALSAADLSSSPIAYIEMICLYPMVLLTFFLQLFGRAKLRIVTQVAVFWVLIVSYWIMINYSEFDDRVASWSTFSSTSIWFYVFIETGIPLLVCLSIFSVGLFLTLKKFANKAFAANKKW